MIRIAIFVEGQTERKFAKKLIGKRYGHLTLKVTELVRKGKNPYISNEAPTASACVDCSFLLVEVPSRDKLISYVVDNASNMVVKQDFVLLLGLQDLFPNKRSDKMQIMNSIDEKIKKSPQYNKISVVLAVMETEAWFLCDWQMFTRIDSKLTNTYIQSCLGFDIVNDDPELVYNHPARTLDEILRLANHRYRKHKPEIESIVNNLDLKYLCSCTGKIDSFFNFVSKLDNCIQSS